MFCDAPFGLGGTWNRDDVIVFSPAAGLPLHRVSAVGWCALCRHNAGQSAGALLASIPQFSAGWPAFSVPGAKREARVECGADRLVGFGGDNNGDGLDLAGPVCSAALARVSERCHRGRSVTAGDAVYPSVRSRSSRAIRGASRPAAECRRRRRWPRRLLVLRSRGHCIPCYFVAVGRTR